VACEVGERLLARWIGPPGEGAVEGFFSDPGIGEVAGVHDKAVPDPDDLGGRRGERPARGGHGPRRPYLGDHYLRVLGLVKLCHLEVLQSTAVE
jgi:hypothetical protein